MNNEKHLISIVIPVYKVEKYLRRCIESVLSQTYKFYELILVDDGSPDNCPAICDEYAGIYENIIVIHKENQGVSAARNSGIEAAKGKYITFIDSDDFVDESFLEILKTTLDVHNVSISMCSYKRVNDSSQIEKSKKNEVKVINDFEAMNMLLDDQSKCAPWGKLYEINLFQDLRFPVGKIMEDMFVMPVIFEKAKFLSIGSQELYFYNQEGESITRSTFNYNKLDMVEAADFWKKHTSLHYPELSEKASIHFFTVIINNCMYLTKADDSYGKSKYYEYKAEILNSYKHIINSKYTTRNTRIKVILLKFNLFRLFTKLL
ncbi:glycosyltransferase family 2 protein [Flavobacterium sp. CLA17]|uniref:glycosyltransferase family 2 protein n=1 Tax=Flavobacterium sp. CLA17 TaxID=2724135 RepID=UPI001490CEAE|nr:glycosyltransferase family 2 protein [Flavobacterium sp. CLA17]QSB27960.1 glycosyltransferase family 2 protein [Flavobacterium sp. CLA17]